MLLIKVGGGAGINWDYIAADLKNITKKRKVIIVHGANAKRDEIAVRLGHPTKTITSPSGVQSVYTDKRAIEIFLMAYPGLVNKQIVAKLQSAGINAVGLSGVDGRLWEGVRKKNILAKTGNKTKLITDSLTGRVEKINTGLIDVIIKSGFLPVVCPPAISTESEIINVDGDWAVSIMAKEMKIKEVVFLFEAAGLMKDLTNPKSLVKTINKQEIDKYMKFAKNRMKKKLIATKNMLENDKIKIYFGDGRVKKPITSCLSGKGTIII